MNAVRRFLLPALVASAALLAVPSRAAEDEFKFMPKGGRDLFVEVLAACTDCNDIIAFAAKQGGQEAWLKYFSAKQSRQKSDPKKGALAGLSDKQTQVLLTYLAVNTPLSKENLPRDTKGASWTAALPPDGRQLALEKCMGCHSLGVTVLNEADYRGWSMIMRKSDHVVIRMKEKEIETLKQYLSIITPMSENEVPKQLRESSGTY